MDFSFKGINISEYGLHYAPEHEDWHIWDSDYKVFDKEVDSQDGGHWYGSKVEPKKFNLRCYFEEITESELNAALTLFRKDAGGKLIFDERPWMAYQARMVDKNVIDKYPVNGGYSGTVMLKMVAHYPFAVSDYRYLSELGGFADMTETILGTTGFVDEASLPSIPPTPLTSQTTMMLYNAGNAKADTVIKIAGDVGNGIIIYNAETKQRCKVINMTQANTTAVGKHLEIRSKNGECALTDGASETRAYRYHDNGYIQLVPNGALKRSLSVTTEGNIMTSFYSVFDDDDVGKHVFIDGEWAKIMEFINPKEVALEKDVLEGIHVVTPMRFNTITITPLSEMNLTKFEIEHRHTFK